MLFQVAMYQSLVSVMGEVVSDLDTSHKLHPRAGEWRARLMDRLLEYGDRDTETVNNNMVYNNVNQTQHGEYIVL